MSLAVYCDLFLVISFDTLLCLICKLNFIVGMYV